jgi:hypothetical protein
MKRTWALLAGALALGLVVSAPAFAKPATPRPKVRTEIYQVKLVALNTSGVRGNAQLQVRGASVRVLVNASRLTTGTVHAIAIQGFSGDTTKAVIPPASAAGTDGIITGALGEPFFGDPMLSLVDSAGASPSSDASGALHFKRTFAGQSALRPLRLRTIVVYGGIVNGVYDPTLPVACGVVKPINKWAKVADRPAPPAKVKGPHGKANATHGKAHAVHGKGKALAKGRNR